VPVNTCFASLSAIFQFSLIYFSAYAHRSVSPSCSSQGGFTPAHANKEEPEQAEKIPEEDTEFHLVLDTLDDVETVKTYCVEAKNQVNNWALFRNAANDRIKKIKENKNANR